MKKRCSLLFGLCLYMPVFAAASAHSSPRISRKLIAKSAQELVKDAVDQTHYFMPTKRYFDYAHSQVRCHGGSALAIIGVAAADIAVMNNLKRAATLTPLNMEASVLHNLESMQKLFEELMHATSAHFKYHITLALVQKKLINIGHAYSMHAPTPQIKEEIFPIDNKVEHIVQPLKVIGRKAHIHPSIVRLLHEGARKDAQDFLNAHDRAAPYIDVGGVFGLHVPACLAMLQKCRPRSNSMGAQLRISSRSPGEK